MEFHFAIPEPSDEDKKAMREHADREAMEAQAVIHEHVRLFEELTAEQVFTLQKMVHQASHSPQQAYEWVNVMEGYLAAILTHKFGMCPCGTNHDEELSEALQGKEDEGGDEHEEE